MKRFDVVLYTWPYGLEPLQINCGKQYFIPHDFIYTHCFSSNSTYSKKEAEAIYESHKEFLEVAVPIVSTNFIAQELRRTFPEYIDRIHVVYLSHFNDADGTEEIDHETILHKYGIGDEYILSANNSSVHKNIGQIASAIYHVKKKYPNLQLVLTGPGTQDFTSMINSPLYSDWFVRSNIPDIMGLGMIADKDFRLILKNAKLVIPTSLCEAGSGSGLDAWHAGVPFVSGDIPAIREQVDFLGTKAEFCDPRNSISIADAILSVLENRDIWKKNVERSKTAMRNYMWDDVAKGYLKIFRENALS